MINILNSINLGETVLVFSKIIRLANSQTQAEKKFKRIKIDNINSIILNPLIILIMTSINND